VSEAAKNSASGQVPQFLDTGCAGSACAFPSSLERLSCSSCNAGRSQGQLIEGTTSQRPVLDRTGVDGSAGHVRPQVIARPGDSRPRRSAARPGTPGRVSPRGPVAGSGPRIRTTTGTDERVGRHAVERRPVEFMITGQRVRHEGSAGREQTPRSPSPLCGPPGRMSGHP